MPRKKQKPRLPALKGYRGFLLRVFRKPEIAQAAFVLSIPTIPAVLGVIFLFVYMLILSLDTPSLREIENPELSYASVAYTADGEELARYGWEIRSRITYDSISVHVRNALIATEDHRFYDHWGINLFRTASAVTQSILGELGLPFERQGGSTITQQLARNIYNVQIGFEVSVTRKLKEMVTAIRLEQLYAKDEIAEMYLNTVPFRHNAYGIEAAARTYFRKSATDLNLLESATLIGMLKGTSRYDPVRNPEQSQMRRNTVLYRMVSQDFLDREDYEAIRDSSTVTNIRTADVKDSFAPHYAEQVRQWLTNWGQENDIDIYATGLRIETTLDSRMQSMAQEAAKTTLDSLQAVVDCEWSTPRSPRLDWGTELKKYMEAPCHAIPENRWSWFWERYNSSDLNTYIGETPRYQTLRSQEMSPNEALRELKKNLDFIDSLKVAKSRLEVGFVAIDPRNGHVKAWIGGRTLKEDWYDHVGVAKRQPGSTFKPFTYAAAIDNDYSPENMYKDSVYQYVDESTGIVWSPSNYGNAVSGDSVSMREGLAKSLNTVTAQIIQHINPLNVANLAKNMGINSELNPVRSLALGTSEVTLLELAVAYSTFANQGFLNEPVIVTRILDEDGTVLYEHQSIREERLSEKTAATVTDMLRDVINYGTGIRIRTSYGLSGYDLAGKTGTTQGRTDQRTGIRNGGGDGWFMLMHPELVSGAWVGFNDRRMTFRSSYWGQGAHNALFVVGEFMRYLDTSAESMISMNSYFPAPPPNRTPGTQADSKDRVTW
jgi:penicillin-binding protein 1A